MVVRFDKAPIRFAAPNRPSLINGGVITFCIFLPNISWETTTRTHTYTIVAKVELKSHLNEIVFNDDLAHEKSQVQLYSFFCFS